MMTELPTLIEKNTPASVDAPEGVKTTLEPLSDRILLAVDPESSKTVSGLYLPTRRSPESDILCVGLVVATGPGVIVDGHRIEPAVRRGDRVLFGRNVALPVTPDAKDTRLLLLVPEGAIVARLDTVG